METFILIVNIKLLGKLCHIGVSIDHWKFQKGQRIIFILTLEQI